MTSPLTKLLTNEDWEILSISYEPSEKNPLLIDDIANRLYGHMMDTWPSLRSIVAAIEERYRLACGGDDSCAFAEGSICGLTSRHTLDPSVGHKLIGKLHFHPNGAAARAFVEGIFRADDKALVDHCVSMWNCDQYQWEYAGRFPLMKMFLLGVDLPYYFDRLSKEEQSAKQRWVDVQRKFVAVMQATNRISAHHYEDALGLFYQVDGKILIADHKGSLFERSPFWKWDEYR